MNMNIGVAGKTAIVSLIIAAFTAATLLASRSIASAYLYDTEMEQIMCGNTLTQKDSIKTGSRNEKNGKDIDGIELRHITGPTFYGKMLIVKDPSRIKLSSIYPWKERGVLVDELVKMADAIGGINSGLYVQGRNTGGRPQGIVVCNGEIQNNDFAPYQYLIGMDNKDVLRVIDLSRKSAKEIEQLVKDEGIRDAVCFPEEGMDGSNWMAKIMLDGEERKVDGMKCCINPRTVIAQRADGAILLLATDGRGAGSHIGATAADLVRVMKENGAVTAANLDGGSSTCMYYNGEYIMGSTTFYHATSSWFFPTAFVIAKQ